MPPRYSYWTIIAGGLPTAFRATERDELMPTFTRIRQKHPDARMQWFARGKLWDSPEAAREAVASQRGGTADARPRRREAGGGGSRDRDWRPGGEHRDPRQKFKDAKKARNLAHRRDKFLKKQGATGAAGPRPDRGGKASSEHTGRPPRSDWKSREGAQRARESGGRDPRRHEPSAGPAHRDRPPTRDWKSGETRPPSPKRDWQSNRQGGSAAPKRDWRPSREGGPAEPKRDWRSSREGGPAAPKRDWRSSREGGSPAPKREWQSSRDGGPAEPKRDWRSPREGGPAAPKRDWRSSRESGPAAPKRQWKPAREQKARNQGTEEPSAPPRPRGPNREPRPSEAPPPGPPPRPSEPEIQPPGPPERGRRRETTFPSAPEGFTGEAGPGRLNRTRRRDRQP
jgi:hypothetical protein